MKLSKSLEFSGYFWLPQEPNKKHPGILYISEFGDAEIHITSLCNELSLVAKESQFGEVLAHRQNQGYERIVGIIKNEDKSELVTLEDCFSSEWNPPSNSGISTSTIVADMVFIGASYAEDAEMNFSKVMFSLEGLEEWFNVSVFDVDLDFGEDNNLRSSTVKYSQPEIIRFCLPTEDCEVELVSGITLPELSSVEANLSRKVFISLIFDYPRSLEQIRLLIHRVKNFFRFTTDKVVSLDSIRGYSHEITQDTGDNQTQMLPIQIYYKSTPTSRSNQNNFLPEMLLPFNAISGKFRELLTKWMDAHTLYSPAFDLYFTATDGESEIVEVKFLLLVQAIEVLHRRSARETEMDEQDCSNFLETVINSAPNKEKKEFLKARLRYANELSLQNRLNKMFEPFLEIYKFDKKSKKSFIRRIVDTRNYLTHYNECLESKASSGIDLFMLNLKLEALIQFHLLQIIGLSKDEILSLAHKKHSLKQKLDS